MFDPVRDISWLAVIVATLAYYILGAIWFTPLFGRAWDTAIGFRRPKGHRFPPIYYVVPLISSFVVTVATAWLVSALDIDLLSDALLLALIVGIGYAVSISFNNALTPHTPRPLMLGAVTGTYHLLGIVMVSAILVSLK
ncbi:MAG: DUF1761 domain-containing protein [Gemmatimonadaceae bacterium]|nr:DUF1761 domain-containing protein [Gemmatimonadaceae bacterium]